MHFMKITQLNRTIPSAICRISFAAFFHGFIVKTIYSFFALYLVVCDSDFSWQL